MSDLRYAKEFDYEKHDFTNSFVKTAGLVKEKNGKKTFMFHLQQKIIINKKSEKWKIESQTKKKLTTTIKQFLVNNTHALTIHDSSIIQAKT